LVRWQWMDLLRQRSVSYGPTKASFDKSWKPGDIEKVQ